MQPEHGQHAAGLSFFGAVGVITIQIAGGADAGVVDVLKTWRATLLDDVSCEIDFVVRWANARTELHDHLRRIGAEVFNHLSDRICDDAERGAFSPGMDKANGRRFRIYNVHRATVRDVNTERDARLIGDDAVATGEFAAINSAGDSGHYSAVDNCDLVSVDLLGCEQRPTVKTGCVANFVMGGIEPLQGFGFVVRDIDAGNSLRENVTTDFNCA